MVARIPSTLEPAVLSRSDAKHPNGVMNIGTSTCLGELQAMLEPGRSCCAALAEREKKTRYEAIAQAHLIAIATSGVFGPDMYGSLSGRPRCLTH